MARPAPRPVSTSPQTSKGSIVPPVRTTKAMPAAMKRNPPLMSGRNPTWCKVAPPRIEVGIADSAMAEMMRPALRGERASTSWSFWVLKSSNPARQNIAPPAVSAPPLKMRERKMSKVRRGSESRAWRRAKASAPQAKTTPAAAHTGQLSARDLIARTRLARVIREYRDEGKSQCLWGLGAFGGASSNVNAMATATRRTLRRKTEPHQKCSKKKPPTVGRPPLR